MRAQSPGAQKGQQHSRHRRQRQGKDKHILGWLTLSCSICVPTLNNTHAVRARLPGNLSRAQVFLMSDGRLISF